MPTYEYKCRACGRDVEIFHSIMDPPRRTCPRCGKNALERKIGTGGAVLFKGSGFYQTDYRSESYKKGAESATKPDGASKGGESKSSESKGGDSKPAAKPEAKPGAESASKPPEKRKRKLSD